MAIGTPVSRGTASGTTTGTTGSFTPGAGDTLIAFVFGRKNTSAPAQPTISDSLGGSWTEIIDNTYDPGANPRVRFRAFWNTPAASAMTVTGTISDGASTGVAVLSITGIGTTDFTNQGTNINAAGDPSVTLTTPGATSAVLGFAYMTATNVITQAAGFTELVEFTANTNIQAEICYDISSPAATVSWTSTNTQSVGFGVELKEPSGGGVTVNVTGVSSTGAVGDVIITGAANVAITGAAGAFALGTVTAGSNTIVSVTGLAITSALGNMIVAGAALVAVIGQAMIGAVGTVTVNTSPPPDTSPRPCGLSLRLGLGL